MIFDVPPLPVDGRKRDEIRPISCEVGWLPRAHGSALFTRGETQAVVVTTMGTTSDEQLIETLRGETSDKFLLHYNFPSFSVGEVKMPRGPGRREIGHGFHVRDARGAGARRNKMAGLGVGLSGKA